MRARVLAQNLAQRPWIWHLGEPGRPAFENSQSQLAGQARRGVNCNLWPLLLWPTYDNAHQGDRTPNPPAAGRVNGVTGHGGLGYIKFTKKIKRCQKKWPFKRGGRPRGGRWWGVLLYVYIYIYKHWLILQKKIFRKIYINDFYNTL